MTLIKFSDKPFFRQNPWAELDSMRRGLENWSHFLTDDRAELAPCRVFPALNISEDPNNIYIRAELPGISPTATEIYVEGETLTIKGERQPKNATEDKVSFHRREIEYGRFSRAVTLPTKIDADKISAKTKNGILTITLPKAAEVKPKRINITTN